MRTGASPLVRRRAGRSDEAVAIWSVEAQSTPLRSRVWLSRRSGAPVVASQTIAEKSTRSVSVGSKETETTRAFVGEKATRATHAPWSVRFARAVLVAVFQRTMASHPADAIRVPSEDHVASSTGWVCPPPDAIR